MTRRLGVFHGSHTDKADEERPREPEALTDRKVLPQPARTCCLSLGLRCRIEHDLDALVAFLDEHRICPVRFAQRYAMRDHKRWINFSIFNQLQQWAHVLLHMRL